MSTPMTSLIGKRLLISEPGGRLQPPEALDHDRGPSPTAACRQEHGLPEVLKHGAVPLHPLRPSRRPHRRP